MVAVVKLKEAGQGFSLFEWDDGKQSVAREGEIEGGLGSSMLVAILLPGRGVAFVVVAVLDAPVTSDGFGGTGLVLLHRQAGEEDAGVALEVFFAFFRTSRAAP